MNILRNIPRLFSRAQKTTKVDKNYTKKIYEADESFKNKGGVGKFGEKLAKKYYEQLGYAFVESNFNKRMGEIDLIFQHSGGYIFCEVKTRTSRLFGEAIESLTAKKRRRILRMIQYYSLLHRIPEDRVRADFIAIQIDGGAATLEHFANIELS